MNKLFPTGVKHDEGKPRMDLIPPDVEEALGIILTYGSQEYGDRNWELGLEWGRVYAAARRHMGKFWRGEDIDKDSGLPHIDHALCCLVFLSAYRMRNVGQDTRNRITSPKAEE